MKTKQNNSLSKFVDYKRFTFIIPIVLLALALLVMGIWGVNRGIDYRDSYTFDVYFNTSVDKSQYKDYSVTIKDTIIKESDGKFIVIVTRLNEDITSGCKVNVLNTDKSITDAKFKEQLEDITAVVKTSLDEKNTSRNVRLTDLQFQSAESYSKPFAMGLLTLAVAMVAVFVYMWIRFELKSALSSLIVAPYAGISTLSLMILFRIPFTYNFMLPVMLSTLLAYLLYYVIFAVVKSDMLEKNNMTNIELIYNSITKNKSLFLVFVLGLSAVLLLMMLVFNMASITLLISLLFAVICSIYCGVVLPTTMWCEIYNKENDNRLKARIELLTKRENEKQLKKISTDVETKTE